MTLGHKWSQIVTTRASRPAPPLHQSQGVERVLEYLARYTHRVAISNQRLVRIESDRVVFHYKDYRAVGQVKETALNGVEFIRRLLLHILPQGFQRIRSYGLLANRHRSQNLETCRELLGQDSTPSNTEVPSDRQGAIEVEVWWPHSTVYEVDLLVVVETFAAPPDGQPTPESRRSAVVDPVGSRIGCNRRHHPFGMVEGDLCLGGGDLVYLPGKSIHLWLVETRIFES